MILMEELIENCPLRKANRYYCITKCPQTGGKVYVKERKVLFLINIYILNICKYWY